MFEWLERRKKELMQILDELDETNPDRQFVLGKLQMLFEVESKLNVLKELSKHQ